MTTSVWPAAADNLVSTDSPALLPRLSADAINAMQADMLANGSTSAGKAARTVSSATAFTSGTAYTNTTGHDVTATIATATAGSAVISVAPASAPTTFTAIVTAKVLAAVDVIIVPVPADAAVKVALTTSTGATDWVIY